MAAKSTPPRTSQEAIVCLGFDGPRSPEKAQRTAEFQASTRGSKHMTPEQFQADCLARGLNRAVAQAAFHVFDLDRSGSIDLDEYILCSAALGPSFDPVRDSMLLELRYRTIFRVYDRDRSGALLESELKELVCDLAAGDSHVAGLASGLALSPGTSYTIGEFFTQERLALLKHYALDLGNLLYKPSGGRKDLPQQVVLSSTFASSGASGTRDGVVSFPVTKEALTENIVVHPTLQTSSNWRGNLVNPSAQAFRLATSVIDNARNLALGTLTESLDVSDYAWKPAAGSPMSVLIGSACVKENDWNVFWGALCEETQRLVASQPILVKVPTPAKVFGDLHGQLRDLLLLFREFGFPSEKGDILSTSYVFDGDFVDRGAHQVEVVLLLFALKVAFPARVFLIRGNHESRAQNRVHGELGFESSCIRMFGDALGRVLFERIHEVFDWLPVAAVVSESVLVVHGGIGDGQWGSRDLEALSAFRPISEPSSHPLLMQCLWSDPADSDERMQQGVHGNPRGNLILTFGHEITEAFCARNKWQCIIRGHQLVDQGFKIMHSGRLLTVFSARNYTDTLSNDGALLLLTEDDAGRIQITPQQVRRRTAAGGTPVRSVRSNSC